MNNRYEYWEECLAQSLEEHGVTITAEQLTAVAKDIEGAHDCYGMAFHVHENPINVEIDLLKQKLKIEQEKVTCKECKGTGTIVSQGPYHSSISQCDKCRGEGRHS